LCNRVTISFFMRIFLAQAETRKTGLVYFGLLRYQTLRTPKAGRSATTLTLTVARFGFASPSNPRPSRQAQGRLRAHAPVARKHRRLTPPAGEGIRASHDAHSNPHPPLRGTFSRREKGS
jgi:hypothetical protein